MTGNFRVPNFPLDEGELLLGEQAHCALALNPIFLFERGAAPLNIVGGKLHVGMVNPLDQATISALKFATGYSIVSVQMTLREIEQHLTHEGGVAETLDPQVGAISAQTTFVRESLADRIAAWFGAGQTHEPFLALLGRLFDAGYTPAEAGAMLLQSPPENGRLHPDVRSVLTKLLNGAPLEAAIRSAPRLPEWLKLAMADLASQADQALGLSRLLAVERSTLDRRSRVWQLLFETAAWAIVLIMAWQAVSLSTALLIAAAFLLLFSRIRQFVRFNPNNPAICCEVLDVVSVLAGLQMRPSNAIRVGFARLASVVPTWGKLPDSREDLAQVLKLPPLMAVLLGRGELAIASDRVSRLIAERMDRQMQFWQWVVRGGSPILFAGAVLSLIS